jgi:hypothetical protein
MRIAAFPDFRAVEALYLPHQIGGSMRSAQIHVAIAQGNNRFRICPLTSQGVHTMHKPGVRTENSVNHVLGMLRRCTRACSQSRLNPMTRSICGAR